GRSRKAQDTGQAGARFQIDPHGLCHDQGIRSHASPAQRTGSPLVPAARHQGRGAPCGESFWHWALGADGGHGHAQPPFRSTRLLGAERQPTPDCRQSLQHSPLNQASCRTWKHCSRVLAQTPASYLNRRSVSLRCTALILSYAVVILRICCTPVNARWPDYLPHTTPVSRKNSCSNGSTRPSSC